MKQSNEESIEEAKAKLGSAHGGTHAFKAIRATTANGQATSDVLTLQAGSDLTYRDVGSLLMLVNDRSSATTTKTVSLPAGTRPGFLLALSDLIEQSEAEVGFVCLQRPSSTRCTSRASILHRCV